MKNRVRCSVILPVKNGEKHLAQALGTIERNCTQQDELIIIDDQSTDNSLDIIRGFFSAFPTTIMKAPGKGPAIARNYGLGVARGQYITFLDHDDLWPDHRISSHLELMESSLGIDVVVGKIQHFTDLQSDSLRSYVDNQQLIFNVHLGASTFRRSVFDRVGHLDEELLFSEDHDLFFRIREAGLSICPLHEVSLYYRIHETNMTRAKKIEEMQLSHVLKKSLDRRRLGNRALSPFPQNRQPNE
jgi:glycosyltransferase involved in cell wall biosynthesis